MAPRAPLPPHLRQEIFSLGSRHLGDALGGARRELQEAGLSDERRKVLKAVVRHLEAGAPSARISPASVSTAPAAAVGGWTAVAYGAAFLVAVAWAAATLVRMFG